MSQPKQIWTAGYGKWPSDTRWDRLVVALTTAKIDTLVDIRHSPCSSQLAPTSNYGPRPWHLQADGGITPGFREHGIGYAWVVELGNPQKNDRTMRVLKAHVEDADGGWPVHRGLTVVKKMLATGARLCLLCACKEYAHCHRKLIVEALGDVEVQNL